VPFIGSLPAQVLLLQQVCVPLCGCQEEARNRPKDRPSQGMRLSSHHRQITSTNNEYNALFSL